MASYSGSYDTIVITYTGQTSEVLALKPAEWATLA
jgi:hypothetical protein